MEMGHARCGGQPPRMSQSTIAATRTTRTTGTTNRARSSDAVASFPIRPLIVEPAASLRSP